MSLLLEHKTRHNPVTLIFLKNAPRIFCLFHSKKIQHELASDGIFCSINTPYEGTLSSYALTLMVIHALQVRRVAVVVCQWLLEQYIGINAPWTWHVLVYMLPYLWLRQRHIVISVLQVRNIDVCVCSHINHSSRSSLRLMNCEGGFLLSMHSLTSHTARSSGCLTQFGLNPSLSVCACIEKYTPSIVSIPESDRSCDVPNLNKSFNFLYAKAAGEGSCIRSTHKRSLSMWACGFLTAIEAWEEGLNPKERCVSKRANTAWRRWTTNERKRGSLFVCLVVLRSFNFSWWPSRRHVCQITIGHPRWHICIYSDIHDVWCQIS